MTDLATITLLSYNIDGLNPVNLLYRTHNALALIISENPDVIQLQEVIHETAPLLATTLSCNGYSTLPDPNMGVCHYFTMSFYKKDKFQDAYLTRVPYIGSAASQQGRDSLQLELLHRGTWLLFVNCHLESCGAAFKSPGSAIRIAQLRNGLQKICDRVGTGPAILAGDLNIREPEANSVTSGFVGSVTDASTAIERRPSNTWFIPGPSKFSARYDRVYCNTGCGLTPRTFKVIGGEDIYPPGGQAEFGNYEQLPYRTISDHRGLVVSFEFTPPAGEKSFQAEMGVTVGSDGTGGYDGKSNGHRNSGAAGSRSTEQKNNSATGDPCGTAGSASGHSGGGGLHFKSSGTGSERCSAGTGLGKRSYEETKKPVPVGAEVICLDSDSSDDENLDRNSTKAARSVGIAVTERPTPTGTGTDTKRAVTGQLTASSEVSSTDIVVGSGADGQEERRRRRELMLRAAEARCG